MLLIRVTYTLHIWSHTCQVGYFECRRSNIYAAHIKWVTYTLHTSSHIYWITYIESHILSHINWVTHVESHIYWVTYKLSHAYWVTRTLHMSSHIYWVTYIESRILSQLYWVIYIDPHRLSHISSNVATKYRGITHLKRLGMCDSSLQELFMYQVAYVLSHATWVTYKVTLPPNIEE